MISVEEILLYIGFIAILIVLIVLIVLIAKFILRASLKWIIGDFTGKLFSDMYGENLFEIWIAGKRNSIQNLVELELRAVDGKPLTRPVGPTLKFSPDFDNLMFVPSQLAKLSLPASFKVNMQVTIGPNAKRPMTLSMPIMISGMGYGVALSEESKIALAMASKVLDTAISSGAGPALPEERENAGKYVLQICRLKWGARTDEEISSADMLEVQLGQGADCGASNFDITALQGRASELGGLSDGEVPVSFPTPPGIQCLEDWPGFMEILRKRAKGIPIALKLMASGNLEEELSFAVDLGFDVIVLDGAQGGSHGSSSIKQDDFGLPTLQALVRAVAFLKTSNVSLIIAGGFFTPGACLKALALGADAVYLGTVPLFALTHMQTKKVLPWEPPATLVFYNSKEKHKLNIEMAHKSVVNAFVSMVLEMEEAMISMGKKTLKELNPEDLIALDSDTAELTNVRRSY